MASSNSGEVNFKLIEIWKARNRLRKYIRQTPLLFSQGLSEKCNSEVYLKLESWQLTGCFKVRGAINMISSLSENEREGVWSLVQAVTMVWHYPTLPAYLEILLQRFLPRRTPIQTR